MHCKAITNPIITRDVSNEYLNATKWGRVGRDISVKNTKSLGERNKLALRAGEMFNVH